MAGGEENRGESDPTEPLPPARVSPEPLSQEFPGEQHHDGASLAQPQLSPAQREEEEEEEEEEEASQHAEGQFDGVLDEDTVAEGLHKLGRSAPGTEYVYLNLSLSGRELSDINILSRYVHLQKLDLSDNKINDLSCVSHIPHLLELNASHNELTTYFMFKPPKNLKEVDFSYNQIPKMQDLSAYQSLTKLLLDFCTVNNIQEIRGLEKCRSLNHLSLSHNRLVAISGLENLPIKILNLSSNQLEKITGLDSLKTLQKLDLSRNKITSLEGLEEHDLLETINLEDNQVAELREFEWIKDLPLLRVLNLLKNPLQEEKDYWLLAIFNMLQLTELDLKKISVEEKVAAVNKYDPPPQVVAAKDHRMHIKNSMRQPQRIFDRKDHRGILQFASMYQVLCLKEEYIKTVRKIMVLSSQTCLNIIIHEGLGLEQDTLPSLEAPYPMLVLTGPLACGKRELTHKICRQFKNFFRYGPCHTTRAAYFGEENRLDYYFVSQEAFGEMVNTGKFLATYKYSDYYYGLGRDTVESIAREGLATCVHLEIEGVHSLKNTYFKPRYILLVPMNKGKYEGHLRRKGLFSRPEIEEAVSRVDMYLKINQDFPGYFDAVVNTDELDEAFTELSLLVKAYLGLELPAVGDSIQDANSRAGAGSRIPLLQEQRLSPGGGVTGTIRSSSVNEFLDSSAKSHPGGISDSLAVQLRSVEEASFQRRHSAIRRALSEKAPSAHIQLFQRDLAVTPALSSSRQQLLEPTTRFLLSDGKNSTQGSPLPNPESRKSKPKKTVKGCRDPSPAGGLFLTSPAEGQLVRTPVPQGTKAEPQDPRGAENGAGRTKETELPADNLRRKHSKSKTGSSHVPQLVNCTGSNSKPVLPPIPSGRKRNNP